MFFEDALDYHLVSTEPTPLYMGELPPDYGDAPAPVIVNLCGVFPRNAPLGVVVLSLPMHDTLEAEFVPARADLERFLRAVDHFAVDGPTYWHCHAGINRSGLAVASYLHLYRDLTISQAIENLRLRRSGMVLCNSLFERTLRAWYGTASEQEFQPFSLEMWLRERQGARKG
jgi:protein-tyrosine phosphatase